MCYDKYAGGNNGKMATPYSQISEYEHSRDGKEQNAAFRPFMQVFSIIVISLLHCYYYYYNFYFYYYSFYFKIPSRSLYSLNNSSF